MRILILGFLLSAAPLCAVWADNAAVSPLNTEKVITEIPAASDDELEEPLPVATVEQRPEFPGGESAMYHWLSNNVVLPKVAAEEGVSGRVVVDFVIEKDGRVTNVRVSRSRHPALDKEAVRVVKSMPKWTPGRNDGQPVRCQYTLPVTFRLQ